MFPPAVLEAARAIRPDLHDWQLAMIQGALRSFFVARLDVGPGRPLAMPSQAADALWHAFILDTRAYREFCERAFGGFLHHIPEDAMARLAAGPRAASVDRLWLSTCRQAGIDPRRADRLPILFEIDRLIGLPDARIHDPRSLSRSQRRRGSGSGQSNCGGTGCGSTDGDGDGCDGGDGGCGGGCGGD